MLFYQNKTKINTLEMTKTAVIIVPTMKHSLEKRIKS